MKKTLVAMSGGVDSSVAAALLKQQGYFVVGGYMKNFSPESWEGVIEAECPWQQDVKDVQGVCEKLGIEFRSFNFEKEYKEKVIEYFFGEYASGRTPNPDVMCNKEIKFGIFLKKAKELGFDYVATGHYARLQESRIQNLESRSKFEMLDSRFNLLKGIDPKKDQSYFLYTLHQDQLARTLFPIGEYTKVQIRQMAKEFGLPNWDKKDSQGVCFVGHIKLRDFLRQRLPEKVGEIVEASTGKVIGQHPGAWYYTVGQREGIGIGGGRPYYVAQKDIVANRIAVVTREKYELVHSKEAFLEDIHWISEMPVSPFSCKAKIRYQQGDQDCVITQIDSGFRVEFSEPQFAIAPGQSVVFYDGDQVLGGGIL